MFFLINRFEPAANGIPSSVFFPQSDPEDRLSQCSASLQALLALSPTTVHALSKLVNSVEISDDIIGVIRNVVAKYPPKGSIEVETSIEVPLSVRLWRVSGCHELLASLGFDLMEVGQDQVTLRTGKQANRRHCQFVLQALLALFDTQEAPKSLGIDSSSSCESLNDDARSEQPMPTAPPAPANGQQRSVSPVGTVKSLNLKMSRPPLPMVRGSLLRGGGGSGAFISYVRRRGEPDGGRPDADPTPSSSVNNVDSSLANTTDSDLSDGYTSQSQTLNRFENKPKMSYSSLRTPIRIGHPNRGGESDATFTPSPPVTIQNIDSNVSLALAHQTRIRNLYSGGTGDLQLAQSRRPDSSSSASSTTDWESGHNTVLRRAHQAAHMLPPLPPPRQTMPLVDSLRPLAPMAPVYNNLNAHTVNGAANHHHMESTSSDSEFERGLEKRGRPHVLKQKPLQQQFMSRKISDQMVFMDRLSVRTEVSGASNPPTVPVAAVRKPPTLPEDDETNLSVNANNLYFTATETEDEQQPKDTAPQKTNTKDNKGNMNIQDSIMRQMNREMTPTISEVYHERNLGLGLAPPLSKLLLSKNYEDTETKMSGAKSTISEATSEMDLSISTVSSPSTNGSTNTERCALCNGTADVICSCKNATSTPKMAILKPWLSNVEPNVIKPSEMSTADLLERQTMIKNGNGPASKRNSSPFSELSRRDEGDGRSVADSNCSSSYKADVATTTKIVDIQQRINQFNLGSAK